MVVLLFAKVLMDRVAAILEAGIRAGLGSLIWIMMAVEMVERK